MLNPRSSIRVIVVAIFALLGQAALPQDEYIARADESVDPLAIAKYTDDIFMKSESISVRFVPLGNTVHDLGMNEIDSGWEYKYTVRCPVSCDRSVASLRLYLSSGRKLDRGCPTPLHASVEFRKSGKTVAKVYVRAGGGCFQFSDDEAGYYTDHEFQPVLEEFWAQF